MEANKEAVHAYFDSDAVVDHYARAAERVGLWESEEKIFQRLFKPKDSLLELGCGAGRIAFGMHELGYRNLLGMDFARNMVRRARHMAEVLEYSIPFRVGDATDLEFEDAVFDGAIFGFNGLMQIPKATQRLQALREIFRVLRPGAWFVFTTHDRERSPDVAFWKAEQQRWINDAPPKGLHEFGDRLEPKAAGVHFMHVPTIAEMEAKLRAVGFHIEAHLMRSELANESKQVREFSDDCRIWVVQRPA
ncbi:MAG: Demethylrebeccamycin-D-glucose O-methyltransferase [Opitutia bacterium UBA7350]|nr:MAG: Demethylrebeccamycin-D-glucose O-methyltransferase [Opitutae bacterium UBA7350]